VDQPDHGHVVATAVGDIGGSAVGGDRNPVRGGAHRDRGHNSEIADHGHVVATVVDDQGLGVVRRERDVDRVSPDRYRGKCGEVARSVYVVGRYRVGATIRNVGDLVDRVGRDRYRCGAGCDCREGGHGGHVDRRYVVAALVGDIGGHHAGGWGVGQGGGR